VAPLVNLLPRADMLKRGVYALGTDDFVQRLTDAFTVFTPAMKCRLYRDWPVSDPAESLRYWDEPVTGLETLARHLYIESRFSLPDNLLVYGDKMAMAWSLEARHPLLDLELMRFVEALPARARFRGPTGHKYLYRKAIARWLPDEILRRRKVAFETPFDEWLQREITGDIREKLTSPDSACARYFDTGYIGELVERHAARRQDYTRMLVNLLFFEEWHRRFLGGPDGPPPADSAVAGARPGVAVISRGGMQ
jgi:asparagine synthase (glutamine-hydrolysing)